MDAVEPNSDLLGSSTGCTLLFSPGSTATSLPSARGEARGPVAAAGIVLASGLLSRGRRHDLLATLIAPDLAVGDHERLQPARQHGRPGGHARGGLVRRLRGARRRAEQPRRHRAPALARPSAPCVGSCPSTFARPACAVFMGDSGSQMIGFGLASLGLASSWTAAGATLTGIAAAPLVLAIPILDTTLVTIRQAARSPPRHPGRPRPFVAPARLLRAVGVAGGRRARAPGGAPRPDGSRLQRAQQPARDSLRRPHLVRRPRSVRELPRRPRGALAPRRAGRTAVAPPRARLAAPPARRGARRLRHHLHLVSRLVPALHRRQGRRRCSARSSSRPCRCSSASAMSSSSCSGSTAVSGASRRRAT